MTENFEEAAQSADRQIPETVPEGVFYLGDAAVVDNLLAKFANAVLASYDQFLRGTEAREVVMPEIEALCETYGDVLMGRDERYAIAPWQGAKLKGKFLAMIPSMKGGDEPGAAMCRHLALMCIKASLALADGHDEDDVGENLSEILIDARDRILGNV